MRTLLCLLILLPSLALADGLDDVVIEVTPLDDHHALLTGRGGNMVLQHGPDGAFLVDDQFAPLTERILAAVKGITDQPVRWVVNTHWHGDHTGGNENLGKAGAVIVAHDNVHVRMSAPQFMKAFGREVPAAPDAARPVVTFDQTITFHWNGEAVTVKHVGPAHTDGDSIVHFATADVIHAGDTYFNGFYPFIDTSSGGRIQGVIDTADLVLSMSTDATKIVPGHGPLASKADLKAYRDMLVTARDAIQPLLDAGKTVEEIVAAKPTAALDPVWGGGFMKPDVWVGIVAESMK